MQLSQFNLYAMQVGQVQVIDEVDQLIRNVDTIIEYDDVRNFIENRFGEIDGWKQFDYPKENKQIAITVNDEEITFCAAKDYQQYYGTSWKLSK